MAKNPLTSFAKLVLAVEPPSAGWQAIGPGCRVPFIPFSEKHARICLGRLWGGSDYYAQPPLSVRRKRRCRMMYEDASSRGSGSESIGTTDASYTASSASMTARSVPTVQSRPLSMLANMMIAAGVLSMVAYLNLVNWKNILFFVGGGLFFSTLMNAALAAYAYGVQKTRRASSLFMLVARRVGVVLGSMLRAFIQCWVGQECLLPPLEDLEDKNLKYTSRWSAALAILRDGLSRARQMASDGVKAITVEAKLSTRAVGKLELVVLQHIVSKLMPRYFAGIMRNELTNTLENVTYPNVRSLHLKQFDVGAAEPQLLGARLYDLGEEDLAIDVDVQWHSQLAADINVNTSVGAQIPFSVRNMHFEGPVRFILTKLSTNAPHYGALLVSLPTRPTLVFELRAAGAVLTRLPGLGAALEKSIQLSLDQDLIWPRRIVIPAEAPLAQPELALSPDELSVLTHDDPLLRAERELSKRSTFEDSLPADRPKDANDTVVKLAVGDKQRKSVNTSAALASEIIPTFSQYLKIGNLAVFKEGRPPNRQQYANNTGSNMSVGDEQRRSADERGVLRDIYGMLNGMLAADAPRDVNGTTTNTSVVVEQRESAGRAGGVASELTQELSKYFQSVSKQGPPKDAQRSANDTAADIVIDDEQRESADTPEGVPVEGPRVGLAKYFQRARQSVFKEDSSTDVSDNTNDTIVKIAIGDELREWADTAAVDVENAQDFVGKYLDNFINITYQGLIAWGAVPSDANETVARGAAPSDGNQTDVKVPIEEEQRQTTDTVRLRK